MNQAIIFDLDGTLWDSSEQIPAIWNRVFARYDTGVLITPEILQSLMGKTMAEIGRDLFPALSSDRIEQIMDDCGKEEVAFLTEHGAVLYDGLEDTLKALQKDYVLLLVSNCQEGYALSFLTAHHIGPYFTDYEESGRTGLSKAENIRRIMNRNQIRKAVYVGDTDGDESASREAGIPFIYAAYGFGKAKEPDAVIESLQELPDRVSRMI